MEFVRQIGCLAMVGLARGVKMLFPEDPDKRTGLWDELRRACASSRYCYLVSDGRGRVDAGAVVLGPEESERFLGRMRAAAFCRVGARHGNPISPFFAAVKDGATAVIVEFVVGPSSGQLSIEVRTLRRELEIALLSLFFDQPQMMSVRVPLRTSVWEVADLHTEETADGLVFTKKSLVAAPTTSFSSRLGSTPRPRK